MTHVSGMRRFTLGSFNVPEARPNFPDMIGKLCATIRTVANLYTSNIHQVSDFLENMVLLEIIFISLTGKFKDPAA